MAETSTKTNLYGDILDNSFAITPTAPLLCEEETKADAIDASSDKGEFESIQLSHSPKDLQSYELNKKPAQVSYTKPQYYQPLISPQPPVIIIKTLSPNATTRGCNCENAEDGLAQKEKLKKIKKNRKNCALLALSPVIVFFLWYIPYIILGNHWMFWKY